MFEEGKKTTTLKVIRQALMFHIQSRPITFFFLPIGRGRNNLRLPVGSRGDIRRHRPMAT